MTPAPTATEQAIQTALNDNTQIDGVIVRMERGSDGHVFTATKGVYNNRHLSSSTVKPILGLACLWAVHKGYLTLSSLAVDEVAEFDAVATNEQRNINLGHLISFTSGLSNQNPAANFVSSDWEDYVDNLAGIFGGSDDTIVPGTEHRYATDQHGVAAVMCVRAGGFSSWAALMTAMIADTGLFGGLSWTDVANHVFSGNISVLYTPAEYHAFLFSIFRETVLTPALCQDLYADAIPSNPSRTAMFSWFVDVGEPGEDWHFARGLWLEERAADWTGTEGRRVSTVGLAGQYCFYDRDLDIVFTISPYFPPSNPGPGDPTFMDGVLFARSIDSEITTWASE